MVTLNSEWHKFRSVRELWVGLGLALLLTLLHACSSSLGLAAPVDWLWLDAANYQFGMLPLLLPVALIPGLASSFCGERRGPWGPLRCTSRGLAETFSTKVFLALLLSVGAAVLLCVTNLAVMTVRYDHGISLLLRNDFIMSSPGLRQGATILEGWLTQLGYSVLGACCLSGLVLLLSCLLRRALSVMATALLLYGLPACVHYGLLPGSLDVLNAAAWSWVGMLSYDWPRTVGAPLWAFPLYMLAVLAAELALVRLAWRRRDTH